jgi:hypothetical protein
MGTPAASAASTPAATAAAAEQGRQHRNKNALPGRQLHGKRMHTHVTAAAAFAAVTLSLSGTSNLVTGRNS